MDDTTRIWQLEEGWYQGEKQISLDPAARESRLYRPAAHASSP